MKMFPRNSFQAALCALVALCLISVACSSRQQGSITRQQVSAFLDEIDKAARNRDVEAIVSHISPDAQFKITIKGMGPGMQTLTLNRDQYRDYSKQALDAVEAYEYRRGETVINVDPDGQTAYVADESFETLTMRGQVMKSTQRGSSTLKLEDGKLVITASESVAEVEMGSTSGSRVSFK